MKKIFLFTLLTLFSATSASAFTSALNSREVCPVSEQITQNLRSGAYNGNYHPYTSGTVTEAHLLQRHLNRLGFSSGEEDGKIGPISTRAIQRMQTYLGTKPDGIVGPLTRAVLNNSCEPSSQICLTDVDPACGVVTYPCNGKTCVNETVKTYSNSCVLYRAGATYLYSGVCILPSLRAAIIQAHSSNSVFEDYATI
jgi:hypothetical protein